MTHCLLTLDLTNASEEQRNTFYEMLAQHQWNKLAAADTTWTKDYDRIYEGVILRDFEDELMEAARETRIEAVNFVLQIGNHEPRTGGIERKNNLHRWKLM